MRALRLGLALLLPAAGLAFANTYAVTTTGDSGAGSLRQAILDANANPGADTISFSIAGSGVHTIAPGSALPAITARDDRRLHAGGLLAEHEPRGPGPEHRPDDRARRFALRPRQQYDDPRPGHSRRRRDLQQRRRSRTTSSRAASSGPTRRAPSGSSVRSARRSRWPEKPVRRSAAPPGGAQPRVGLPVRCHGRGCRDGSHRRRKPDRPGRGPETHCSLRPARARRSR